MKSLCVHPAGNTYCYYSRLMIIVLALAATIFVYCVDRVHKNITKNSSSSHLVVVSGQAIYRVLRFIIPGKDMVIRSPILIPVVFADLRWLSDHRTVPCNVAVIFLFIPELTKYSMLLRYEIEEICLMVVWQESHPFYIHQSCIFALKSGLYLRKHRLIADSGLSN